MYVNTTPNAFTISTSGNILTYYDDVVAKEPEPLPTKKVQGINKGKKKMFDTDINVADADIAEKREYLRDRYFDLLQTARVKLRKQFFLDEDEYPKTMKEFVDRIKAGKYVLSRRTLKNGETPEDDSFYFDLWRTQGIMFRDPANKADQKGYDAAVSKLEKDYQYVLDAVVVLDPKEGLAKLQEMESKLETL